MDDARRIEALQQCNDDVVECLRDLESLAGEEKPSEHWLKGLNWLRSSYSRLHKSEWSCNEHVAANTAPIEIRWIIDASAHRVVHHLAGHVVRVAYNAICRMPHEVPTHEYPELWDIASEQDVWNGKLIDAVAVVNKCLSLEDVYRLQSLCDQEHARAVDRLNANEHRTPSHADKQTSTAAGSAGDGLEWSKPVAYADLRKALTLSQNTLKTRLVEGHDPVEGKIRYRTPTPKARKIQVVVSDLPTDLQPRFRRSSK